MIEFLKTKTGVFVTAGVIFVFALIAFLTRKSDGETPAVPAATTQVAESPDPLEPPPVTKATTLPSAVAARAAGLEANRTRVNSNEGTDNNGVAILRRQTAQSPGNDSAGRVHYYGNNAPEEEDGIPRASGQPGGQNAPKLAIRIAPAPRREPQTTGGAGTQTTASTATPPAPNTHPTAGSAFATPIDKERFAPYGRLIKCELVLTIDSTTEQTPVLGLVVEDQWWNGKLIIPAGTEVHGVARVDRERDRVFTDKRWVLIMPRQNGQTNGREMILEGVGLDRDDRDGSGITWGLDDGSYGLRGYTVKTQDKQELMLFAASFLNSAAGALQDTSTNGLTGTVTVQATGKNAALAGTQAVLTRFAEQMMEEIRRHGVFIRVPAGKQFYLYVTQPIAPDVAEVGGSQGLPRKPTPAAANEDR